MSITDVLSRISQIEQQVTSLESGTMTAGGVVSTAEANNSGTSDSGSTDATSGSGFSDALAQAQASDPSSATTASDDADAMTDPNTPLTTGYTSATGPTITPAAASATDPTIAGSTGETTDTGAAAFPSLADSALATTATATTADETALALPTGTTALATGGVSPYATTDTAASAGVALPASTATMLTSGQQQFASTLSADTGLSPAVISSWLLSEESGGAAQSRQAASNNDWLNVGYTGSGDIGTSDAIWSDPTTAANATADWLKGENSIPGYGTASSGIQAILGTVGQTPQAQMQALQTSGWSGSGYPSLPEIYASVTGS